MDHHRIAQAGLPVRMTGLQPDLVLAAHSPLHGQQTPAPSGSPSVREPARQHLPMLPGDPFRHLPAEVARLVLRNFRVFDLLNIAQLSRASQACMQDYRKHDLSPAQRTHFAAIAQRRRQREMVYSSKMLADTWDHPQQAPTAARQARARQWISASPHVRVALAAENRVHWSDLLAAASCADWQVLELDLCCDVDGVGIASLPDVMGSITGVENPGRALRLCLTYELFDDAAVLSLHAFLNQHRYIDALMLTIAACRHSSLSKLGSMDAANRLRKFDCRFKQFTETSDSEILQVIAGNSMHEFCIDGLSFHGIGVDALVNALTSHHGLTQFSLGKIFATSGSLVRIVEALAGHAGLLALHLDGCDLSVDAAAALAKLICPPSALESLSLHGVYVSDSGMATLSRALAGNVSLTRFEFCVGKYTLNAHPCADGNIALWKALLANRTLQALLLKARKESAENGRLLEQMLCHNTTLEDFTLCLDQFDSAAAASAFLDHLLQGLAVNTGLARFSLRASDEVPIDALVAMLQTNRTLRRLDLDGVIKNAESLASLATGLQGKASLTDLSVQGLPICRPGPDDVSDLALDALCTLLGGENGLRRLHLIHCNIDRGTTQLAAALEKNRQLGLLDLSQNKLDASGLPALFNAIADHPALSVILLDQIFFEHESLLALAAALHRRTAPLFLSIDSKFFTPFDENIISEGKHRDEARSVREKREIVRAHLLAATPDKPQVIIADLKPGYFLYPQLDWRDFVPV